METDLHLVSIIIPTYNGEKHISKTLNSIIEQDYENIEIILADDVSSDNTVKISREILENSGKKFKIIERSKNGGQCAARNTGYKEASGKYVIFFDHDDMAEKNFVSLLCAEAENKNADVVFCGIKHFYENENKFEYEPVITKNNFLFPEDYLKGWISGKIYLWSVWNFIFKKTFLDEFNLCFHEGCRLGEDTELVLKALSSASRVSFVEKMLYIYFHWPEQTYEKYSITSRKFDIFKHIMLSRFRAGRYIIRHTKNRRIKNYVLNFFIPDAFITYMTTAAKTNNHENYNRLVKSLKHKKIRELLLSTSKFIFRKPELFFKSLMLIYMPDFYYKLRNKK